MYIGERVAKKGKNDGQRESKRQRSGWGVANKPGYYHTFTHTHTHTKT